MIRIEHLNYAYRRGQAVFEDFSLDLPTGHIYGLLGCNGVGKSTLMKLLCGRLQAQSGTLRMGGLNPAGQEVELLQQLVLVPEEIYLPPVSLRRYAELTAPFYPSFSWEEFRHLCRELDIDEEVSTKRFSMGLKKRACLAFALACNTKYLLMDEPTNGLDIPSKQMLRRLLAAHASDERTILISTHQIRDIETLIDHLVICDTRGVVLSADLGELGRKFTYGKTAPDVPVIYTESTPQGDISLAENLSGEETQPDIELLFNATLQHRETIRQILQQQETPRT